MDPRELRKMHREQAPYNYYRDTNLRAGPLSLSVHDSDDWTRFEFYMEGNNNYTKRKDKSPAKDKKHHAIRESGNHISLVLKIIFYNTLFGLVVYMFCTN